MPGTVQAHKAGRVRWKSSCQLLDVWERAHRIVLASQDEHRASHAVEQAPRAEIRGLIAEEMQVDINCLDRPGSLPMQFFSGPRLAAIERTADAAELGT